MHQEYQVYHCNLAKYIHQYLLIYTIEKSLKVISIFANVERLFRDRVDGLTVDLYLQNTEDTVRESGAWAQSKPLWCLS